MGDSVPTSCVVCFCRDRPGLPATDDQSENNFCFPLACCTWNLLRRLLNVNNDFIAIPARLPWFGTSGKG